MGNVFSGKRIHGMYQTAEYAAWCTMRGRCNRPTDKAYPYYGGRGIKVCSRWSTFAAFIADMGRKPSPLHTLERIDNDGPYSPENCRWATRSEQNENTRYTVKITHQGLTMSISAWARKIGIPHATLRGRIQIYKWPIDRAMTERVRSWGR